MSSYENVVGGRLRFKNMKESSIKKKKKKSKSRKHEENSEKHRAYPNDEAQDEEAQISERDLNSVPNEFDDLEVEKDKRTEAEKRFNETRMKREEEMLRKAASKTYREKVEEFSEKLATLPEHFDVPKVGYTK